MCTTKCGTKVEFEVECRGTKIKCERRMLPSRQSGWKNDTAAMISTFKINAITIYSNRYTYQAGFVYTRLSENWPRASEKTCLVMRIAASLCTIRHEFESSSTLYLEACPNTLHISSRRKQDIENPIFISFCFALNL